MGVWRVGDKSSVVLYRSPGIEPADTSPPEEPPAGEPRTIKIVRPEKLEEGSGAAAAAEVIREFARMGPPTDDQVAAQVLRRRLVKALGPIWHVAVGPNFEFDATEDRRNEVIAFLGKSKVVVFQHEQFEGWNIEWSKIFNAVPYLLLVIFCFAMMAQQRICDPDGLLEPSGHEVLNSTETTTRPPPSGTFLERQLCGEKAEGRIYTIGVVGLVFLVTNSGKKALNGRGGAARAAAKNAMAEGS